MNHIPQNIMSSIGWIDFSSEHREKVRTVIDLLSAPGVVDELGIGVVRDSFADRMFPGISTIQTRAKYFTLTALLVRNYQVTERNKRNPRTLERYLEDEEKNCRIALVNRHGEGRLNLGIIGGSFGSRADRDVVRRPSSVYWNGLRRFGFISPSHLSLAEFGRRLSDERKQLRALLEETKQERGDDHDAEDSGMRIRIRTPEIGADYWAHLSIDLTHEEAVFLRDQITNCQRDSLIGQILRDDTLMDQVLALPGTATFDEFSELPLINELKSQELRSAVLHARDFWQIMEGAHIRYNCLLQSAGFGTNELKESFNEQWETWRKKIAEFPPQWDSSFMWALVHRHGSLPKPHTRNFITYWIQQAKEGAGNLHLCDQLVTNQERLNKGSRARLRPENQEAVNGWIGLNRVEYRLPQVIQLIRDIREGEQRKGGADA
jgi:hypothetical protein